MAMLDSSRRYARQYHYPPPPQPTKSVEPKSEWSYEQQQFDDANIGYTYFDGNYYPPRVPPTVPQFNQRPPYYDYGYPPPPPNYAHDGRSFQQQPPRNYGRYATSGGPYGNYPAYTQQAPTNRPGASKYIKRQRTESEDQKADRTTKASKKKKKTPVLIAPTKKPWTMEEAQFAYDCETAFNNRNKNQSLIIKFPDIEIDKVMVKGFYPGIRLVHFQQPSTPRFCFVTLEDESDPEDALKCLNNTRFGTGMLSAEYKKDREDGPEIGAEDIDPYTLYVGNLAQDITKEDLVRTYPKKKRIDIGYAKRMKHTRYAFVSFWNVQDATEAFKMTRSTQLYDKSLIVRFRRLKGTVGMPGEAKVQNPPKSKNPAYATDVTEVTEVTEATEVIEVPETTEAIEITETIEATQTTETTVTTETSETTKPTEPTEPTDTTEITEITHTIEAIEPTSSTAREEIYDCNKEPGTASLPSSSTASSEYTQIKTEPCNEEYNSPRPPMNKDLPVPADVQLGEVVPFKSLEVKNEIKQEVKVEPDDDDYYDVTPENSDDDHSSDSDDDIGDKLFNNAYNMNFDDTEDDDSYRAKRPRY